LAIAVYSVTYSTFDSFIYLISAFMVFSLWFAVGIAVLAQGIGRYAAGARRLVAYRRQIYVGVFVLVTLAVPVWSIGSGWDDVDLSGKDAPAQFVEAAIKKATGGVILAEDPQLFALVYQAQVANPELDVMVVLPSLLQHDWYWDQLVRFYGDRMPAERPAEFYERVRWVVTFNLGVVPVYSTADDRLYHAEFNMIPDGDLFRVEY